jgi:hypothetical protein
MLRTPFNHAQHPESQEMPSARTNLAGELTPTLPHLHECCQACWGVLWDLRPHPTAHHSKRCT